MLNRRVAVAFAALLLLSNATAAQAADLSGAWGGQWAFTEHCDNGQVRNDSGTLTASLSQSGTSVTGQISLNSVPNINSTCQVTGQSNVIGGLSGTVSGASMSGSFTVPGDPVALFSASVGADVITITFLPQQGGTSGTITLTRGTTGTSSDITGSWSGTFNANDTCGGGNMPERPIQWSSPATLVLVQQQSSVTGAIIVYAVPDYGDQCQVVSTFPIVLPVSGQFSGSTFSGTLTTPDGSAAFTAAVSGSSMNINVSAQGFSATASLTRGSSQAPDTRLTGSYSGSYTSRFIPCPGSPGQLPPITLNGSISGALSQIGQAFTGAFTITGLKRDQFDSRTGKCTITDDPTGTHAMSGQISGNSLSGVFFPDHPDGELHPFSATVSGNTITGFSPGEFPGESLTFTITRSGAPSAPPQVLSFIATPRSIRAGQSTTLSWSTDAATSVTIDNGVGNQASSGSLTVTPSANTTYTLTATQGTQSVTASVSVEVLVGPIVNVTSIPATMLQAAGGGGGTTSYALTNSGSASTTITLGQNGSFFTQSPSTFTLAPGATQVVTIAATPQSANTYEGASNPSGNGVPSGLQIPVKLVSAPAPTGTVTADPSANRVDVAGGSGASPTGSVTFKNNGTARLVGVLNSDAPWIIPQSGTVTIDPGQTVTLTFTIDRSKRPDASALAGSAEGSLTLSFLSGSGSSFAAKRPLDGPPPTPSVSLVKVVDTVQPTVTTTGIPAIAAGEVALFVAGVGHVTGTRGALFVSDVSVLNPQGSKAVDDLKIYYTSTTGSASAAKSASLPTVPGQVSIAVADVMKSVFSGNEERGTLQVRSKDAGKLALSATVLTINNPAGTYGNAIPVFRSDRSVESGKTLVLTGLRKDSTTHTNLYVQETAGSAASVQIDFLAADGSTVSTRTEPIDAFKLLALDSAVPANAVAAVLTNRSTAGGKIAAYATPLDEASGDTWAIADWSSQLGYSGGDAVIVPVAGSVHGANSTFYRTDLAITNRGSDAASGTLRYVSRTGDKFEQQVTLGANQTKVMNDAISSFNVSGDTVGYLTFTPVAGSVAVSSRTFTTAGGKPDTFGSSVPAISAGAAAIRSGGSRPIAGLADANRSTVVAAKAGTFRTNFALMETTGSAVTVRVTLRFTFPAGQKAQGTGAASRDYALSGNQFLLLNSISGEILGPARLQFGDLTNVEADFQVITGSGAVMLFTSSVDNATGDSILRTE